MARLSTLLLWLPLVLNCQAAPTSQQKLACNGIDTTTWLLSRDALSANIKDFCGDKGAATLTGPITGMYDDVTLTLDVSGGSSFPGEDACNLYFFAITDCADKIPGNPMHWRHGGSFYIGNLTYNIKPTKERYHPGVCSVHVHEREYETGFTTTVIAKDSQGDTLYTTGEENANDGAPYIMHDVYYDDLVLTPEKHGGNYIQFALGDQRWASLEGSVGPQGQKCTATPWDNYMDAEGINSRNISCSMPC